MNNSKRIIAVIICLSMLLATAMITKAASDYTPFEVEIITDKSAYSVYDTINITAKIKNASDDEVTNVVACIKADNLKTADAKESNIYDLNKVSGGEVKEIKLNAVLDRKAKGIGFFERIILFFKQLFSGSAGLKSYNNSALCCSYYYADIITGEIKTTVCIELWYKEVKEPDSSGTYNEPDDETQTNNNTGNEDNTVNTTVINGNTYIIGDDGVLIPYNIHQTYLIEDIIATGRYTLKGTIKKDNTVVPYTYYAHGNKYNISSKIKTSDDTSITSNMLFDGEKAYLLFPTLHMYISSDPSSSIKDTAEHFIESLNNSNNETDISNFELIDEMVSLNLFDKTNKEYIKSEILTIDGLDYVVDYYESDNNEIFKYYILRDIERVEIIRNEDETVIYEFTSISETVPTNAFTIPSGYTDMTNSIIN